MMGTTSPAASTTLSVALLAATPPQSCSRPEKAVSGLPRGFFSRNSSYSTSQGTNVRFLPTAKYDHLDITFGKQRNDQYGLGGPTEGPRSFGTQCLT